EQRSLRGREFRRHWEEIAFMNQLKLAIASVPVESHVPALLQTLVGESQPAGTALFAKIHQVNHPVCASRSGRIATGGNHRPGRFMAWNNGGSLKKLRPF